MKGLLLLYNLKLNCLFFTGLNSSLIIFIRTYTVKCKLSKCIGQTPCSYEHYLVDKKVVWHTKLIRWIWFFGVILLAMLKDAEKLLRDIRSGCWTTRRPITRTANSCVKPSRQFTGLPWGSTASKRASMMKSSRKRSGSSNFYSSLMYVLMLNLYFLCLWTWQYH